MLVIRVELHSAVTRKVTELARMHIWNTGSHTQTRTRADYQGHTLRGRNREALDAAAAVEDITRSGRVDNHQKQALHVWHLVAKMLNNMGYGR